MVVTRIGVHVRFPLGSTLCKRQSDKFVRCDVLIGSLPVLKMGYTTVHSQTPFLRHRPQTECWPRSSGI